MFYDNILIIDCQTTGMHANDADLLQIAWCIYDPINPDNLQIENFIFQLPQDYTLPEHIVKLHSITQSDFETSLASIEIFDHFQKALKKLGNKPLVIAHYAQFEKKFLKKWYLQHTNKEQLNFDLICSQRLAKRLYCSIPSHNLCALAGYFKLGKLIKYNAFSHVLVTAQLVKLMFHKLCNLNINTPEDFEQWNTAKSCSKVNKYVFNIDRLTRLNLPNNPGIYRMLANDKSVLYIGKATSLKSRVNSYFLGVKNKNRRILEMLSQVWDIEFIECDSPLEAALLESDEIKNHQPPYNILLKSVSKKFIYYNRDFTEAALVKDLDFRYGPFTCNDSLAFTYKFFTALKNNQTFVFPNNTITHQELMQSWDRLCGINKFNNDLSTLTFRKLLYLGAILLREFERTHPKGSFERVRKLEKISLLNMDFEPLEELAQKIQRLLIRTAEYKRKIRIMCRIYKSKSLVLSKNKTLDLINGNINDNSTKNDQVDVSFTIDAAIYDRLCILVSDSNHKSQGLVDLN